MNHFVFDNIDTEEKAYWFGFLFADGCVFNNRVIIELSSKDENHLEKFRNFVDADNIISHRPQSIRTPNGSCRIQISSKIMADSLKEKGCVENKSNILLYPNDSIVPKSLERHFVRGYFDGDGCLCFCKSIRRSRSKDPEKARRIFYQKKWFLTFVGTYEALDGIRIFFDDYPKLLHCNGSDNTYHLKYGGNGKIKDLTSKIYSDATIYLDRKYALFQQLLSY